MHPKMLDCLSLASLEPGSKERQDQYNLLCQKWGENVICAKMSRLADRDYIEYGVSPRTGWLTEKGEEALESAKRSING